MTNIYCSIEDPYNIVSYYSPPLYEIYVVAHMFRSIVLEMHLVGPTD